MLDAALRSLRLLRQPLGQLSNKPDCPSQSIQIGSQKEGAILTQFFFPAPLFFARKAVSNPRLVITGIVRP
ncbi:MAG: hypothetical protein ABW090_16100 [Sedimenticola sp.]